MKLAGAALRYLKKDGADSLYANFSYLAGMSEVVTVMAPSTEFQIFIDLHKSMRASGAMGFIAGFGGRFRVGIRNGSLVLQFYMDIWINHTFALQVSRLPNSCHVSMCCTRTGSFPNWSFAFKIYINGELRSSVTRSRQNWGTTSYSAGLEVGKPGFLYQYGDNIPGTFRGIVSEIRLYETVLSDDERRRYMNCTLTTIHPALVHYWPLCGDYVDRITNNVLHTDGHPFFWQTPTDHLKFAPRPNSQTPINKLRRVGGSTNYLIERNFHFEFLLKSATVQNSFVQVLATNYFRIDVRNDREVRLTINNGTQSAVTNTYSQALRQGQLDRVTLRRHGFLGQSTYALFVNGFNIDTFTVHGEEQFLYFSTLEVGSSAAATTVSDLRILSHNIPEQYLASLAFTRLDPNSSLVYRSWPLDMPEAHYGYTTDQKVYFPEVKFASTSGRLETVQPVPTVQTVMGSDIIDPALADGMLRTYDSQGRVTFDAVEGTVFFLDSKTVTSGQTFHYPGVDTRIGCQLVYNGPISHSNWSHYLDLFKQPMGYTTSYPSPEQATINFTAPYGATDQYRATVFSWGEYP